jgi:competence protein ComEC
MRLALEGRIDGVPAREGPVLRFDVITSHIEGSGIADSRPRRIRVSWREPAAEPRAGEQWRLLIRVLPLAETHNFAGRDTARLAFREGVHANGRVLASPLNQLITLAPASVDTMRARIALRVRDAIADPDAAALVTALGVGITAGMSRDQWRVFNITGTTHLVAISGLHVTLFAWLAFRAARILWRLIPGVRIDREPFAGIMGLLAAGAYSLLAGLSVPTQRTWIMLATFVFARVVARRVSAGRFWSVALVIVLMMDPRAPLAAGFWLSFIAVGVLLWMSGPEITLAPLQRLRLAVRSQLVIMLALAPASLAVFGGVSLVGLAVNLIAIPLISFIFVPLVLAGAMAAWLMPAWDAFWFGLAAWLYEGCWPWLVAAAEPPLALWRESPPSAWFALSLPAAMLWLSRGPITLRLTALCALFPLLWPRISTPPVGVVRITALDAARGAAVLVRTTRQTLLFDTGDAWNTRGSRIRDIVIPALDAQGSPRADRVVLPGLDEGRARGVALLAQERGLGEVLVGSGWPGSGLPLRRCPDRHWSQDGVAFSSFSAGRRCLLRLSNGRVSALLAADLDAEASDALLVRLPARMLASEVMIMGRASASASSARWIETISPGLAVIAGGVPHSRARAEMIERWRSEAGWVLDTQQVGAVELELDDSVRLIATARQSRFPFVWRRVPI